MIKPNSRKVLSRGPGNASVMVIGEAPGFQEEKKNAPFVGASGLELEKMLAEAGHDPGSIFYTNVCRYRPPGNKISEWLLTKTKAEQTAMAVEMGKQKRYPANIICEGIAELSEEIHSVDPDLIIPVGNLSLWAVTGNWGIMKWRGSVLESQLNAPSGKPKVVPTLHPAYVLRAWKHRHLAVHDMRRANLELISHGRYVNEPDKLHIVNPGFHFCKGFLESLLQKKEPVSCDIETIGSTIACVGWGRSVDYAVCIPLMHTDGTNFWTLDQEFELVKLMRQILADPEITKIGQNFLFDSQYFARQWGVRPRNVFDTMVCQHVIFPGMEKDLNTLSSLYCQHHRYWKDERKDINPDEESDEMRWWEYNCKDCTSTYEVYIEQKKVLKQLNLEEQNGFLHETFDPVLKGMLRGVRINLELKKELHESVEQTHESIMAFLKRMMPYEISEKFCRSNKQLKDFFIDAMGVKPVRIRDKATGHEKISFDTNALHIIRDKEPWLTRIIDAIILYRTLGTVDSNVLEARTSSDGRFRCSYNIAGPETFRLSSSHNVFGGGCNLQNITAGRKEME